MSPSKRSRTHRGQPAIAAGLVLGMLTDVVFKDPMCGHPVAVFGHGAARLERAFWRDSRTAGAAFAACCLTPIAIVGAVLQRSTRDRMSRSIGLMALSTWISVAGGSLAREGTRMQTLIESGDLAGARERLGHLCARDGSAFKAGELARATVESVAENTSDAVVAPLVWGTVFGPSGILVYRAVNTLDAMVGYRNNRFRRFGWAAARLDDVVNIVPARVTGLLAAALAPVVGGSSSAAYRTLLRDRRAHPSPNAGHCEAAFAGALGVQLGGTNVYHGGLEVRPAIGDGTAPSAEHIGSAVRLSRTVGVAATALVALHGLIGLRRSR